MDRFTILSTIGRGAYGAARLARIKETKELVVIKEVNIFDMSEEEAEKATKEAYFLKKLTHPNIVRYIESFVNAKNLMIVMEYADAGDLERYIRKRKDVPLSEKKILMIFIQICLGLKCVHDNNMLHRDLKPGNLFLNRDGIVKLGDFGVARALKSTIGFAQTVIGTPHYLSPEICDSQEYDQKSDMWSLGCILHELCGRKPTFDGISVPAMILRIMKADYEPIAVMYSDDLRACIASLLQLDPQARPRVADIVELPFMRPVMTRYCERMVSLREKKKVARRLAAASGVPVPPPEPPGEVKSDEEVDVMDFSSPDPEVLARIESRAGSSDSRSKSTVQSPELASRKLEGGNVSVDVKSMRIPAFKGKEKKKHKEKTKKSSKSAGNQNGKAPA